MYVLGRPATDLSSSANWADILVSTKALLAVDEEGGYYPRFRIPLAGFVALTNGIIRNHA